MDSLNGSLTFTPTTVGQAMVSARVDEFRNGILINSSTVEHVMYLVTGCIISGGSELKKADLNLYPIPANETLRLEMPNGNSPLYLEAIDLSGKISKLTHSITASENFEIDIKILTNGIYNLRVVTENGVELKRFVKM